LRKQAKVDTVLVLIMKYKKVSSIVFTIAVIFGIGFVVFTNRETTPEALAPDTDTTNPAEAPVKPQAKTITPTAKYKIEFNALWSATTHPDNYVDNAHFSPFIAYGHKNSTPAKIFTTGGIATAGVEEMAETGAPDILNEEIDQIISAGQAYAKTQGTVFDSPGSNVAKLEVNKDNNYFTFVSMMAPSPDWFVTASTNLIEDEDWIERVELDLLTYDAGTDSGETLTAPDSDTDPKEPIAVFSTYLQKLGKLTLTRIK